MSTAQEQAHIVWEAEGAQLVEYSFEKNTHLLSLIAEQARPHLTQRDITVFNKECKQPRLDGFFSDDSIGYFFSNSVARSNPMTPEMKRMLEIVNEKLGGAEFNGLLINLYRDGSDCVGAHSDAEKGLDPTSGVISISIGSERKFRVRRKVPKQAGVIMHDVYTRNMFGLQMRGPNFQKNYTHEIVAEKGVMAERISITARRHVPEDEQKLLREYEQRMQRKRSISAAM